MAKIKLNAAKGDIPEKKSDIDKMYVLEYTKLNGTPEQRARIKECIKKNTVERVSPLTQKPYMDVKMGEVRKVFCDEFFKNLNKKEKATKTFFDLVDEL